MLQKVIKVGNSAAVTIPKSFMDQANINIGDKVKVDTDLELQRIIIQRKKKSAKKSANQKAVEWVDQFIKDYRPALEKLAKS